MGEKENAIFVLGGPWGTSSPVLIDSVSDLLSQISDSKGNIKIPGCDASEIPLGIVHTFNNNIINLSTNGQCIPFPEELKENFCKVTAAPLELTDLSVLTNIGTTFSQIQGVTVSEPIGVGVPDRDGNLLKPPQSVINAVSTAKLLNPLEAAIKTEADIFPDTTHCTINAPVAIINKTINLNICFDMTEQVASSKKLRRIISKGRSRNESIHRKVIRSSSSRDQERAQVEIADLLADLSPELNINSALTYAFTKTNTNQVVSDCFATGVETIFDALTGETWLRQANGEYSSNRPPLPDNDAVQPNKDSSDCTRCRRDPF